MIITDSFVFLNYPKTGSTFVREALSELYEKKRNTRFPWSRNKRHFEMYQASNVRAVSAERKGLPTPHGTYWQIPEHVKHLPVYSVFRDPVKRFISAFHYADWKKKEALIDDLDMIREKFPMFPELEITEFLAFKRLFAPRELTVGGIKYPFAADFVHFFLGDADRADRKVLEFSSREDLQQAIGSVRFLDNTNLNQELANMLLNHRFSENDVAYIRTRAKSNVSKTSTSMEASREREIVAQEMDADKALICDLVRHSKYDKSVTPENVR